KEALEEEPTKGPQCTIHIRVDGYPLGFIAFNLTRGKLPPGVFGKEELGKQERHATLAAMGNGAVRYQVVFLSYTTADEESVMHLADGLTLGGVALVITQRTHLPPLGKRWEEMVPKLIAHSDAVLLCWSSNAAGKSGSGTEGVALEIKHAVDEKKR